MPRKNPPAAAPGSRFAPLTGNDIETQTDSGSFSRGRTYFRNGHIRETVLRDDVIEARCEGSDIVPYRVRATLAPAGQGGANPRDVACTCPRGGFCKHIVALLLAWIDDPGRFVARPSLADQLADRSRDDLVALIGRMVERDPDLERLVELPVVHAGAAAANAVTIDEAAIRRQSRSAFATSDPWDWHAAAGSTSALYPVLDLAEGYLAAGQWANAQAVFTNVAEEACEVMLSFNDEEGEISGLIAQCAHGLVTCLDAQAGLPEADRLGEEHRERLIQALYDIWRFDVFEAGGIDLAQDGPEAIARNVTDAERAMVEGWLREERPDGWSKRMVTEFLVMLREEAGLDDGQLLEIYRDAELWDDVAGILLRMDRVDEAVAIAGRYLKTPPGLIGFANALIQRGGEHIGRALALVDDHMWEIEGVNPVQDATIQDWLIAQYSAHDRPQQALVVAERRFKGQPTFRTWQLVRDAARLPGQRPEVWTDLRPKLLGQLRKKKAWTVLVDVHLDEGDVAAAIEAYGKHVEQRRKDRWSMPAWGYGTADQDLRLARAAVAEFPDQAVAIYRQKADTMIGQRNRASYKVAAQHLERVKETLVRHNRTEEWKDLIANLRTEHKTLRALREELDALHLG